MRRFVCPEERTQGMIERQLPLPFGPPPVERQVPRVCLQCGAVCWVFPHDAIPRCCGETMWRKEEA